MLEKDGWMVVMILNWAKGNIKVYTKRIDIAERAAREGKHVVVLKDKPHIFGTPSVIIKTC